MSTSFKDKVVVVTGGSDGIGKALVQDFLAAGSKVATCGRNPDKLRALDSEINSPNLFVFQADVSVKKECKDFIDSAIHKFGGIDILINNAGISQRSEFKDVDPDVFRKVMDINFFGTVYCTKFSLESILQKKGSVVGISSIAGFRGLPGRSGYSASKYALNGWLEALRTELLETGVHVLTACPGFTESNIRNAALNSKGGAQGESPMDEGSLMSADECAKHIMKAIANRKRSLILTFDGKRSAFMNRFFPAWTDKLVRKYFYKNGKLIK